MPSGTGGTRIWAAAAAIALLATSCGNGGGERSGADTEAGPTSTTLAPTSTTAAADTADSEGDTATTTTVPAEPAPAPPADGEGLAVRMRAEFVDGLLCPNGRRPCLEYAFADGVEGDGLLVTGRLLERFFWIEQRDDVPSHSVSYDYTNQCPDDGLGPPDSYEGLEAMHAGDRARPAGFVDLWDSTDGVLHIGVVGDDPSAVESFLAANGLAGQLCIVTGFHYSADLMESAIRDLFDTLIEQGYTDLSGSQDRWEGVITVSAPRIDVDFRSVVDEVSAAHGGIPIEVFAGIEVLDGTLDDYQFQLFAAGRSPDPSRLLRVSCGSVVFSSLPPDPDEFPPLDAEGQAALDVFLTGDTAEIADTFAAGVEWTMANRTDESLVLFGRRPDLPEAGYVDVPFVKENGEWRVAGGFGGCHITVDAPGLGPAEVALDPARPADPMSTEIPLLINERACAGGAPPTDREVVPVVIETDESITVIALVAPVEGSATCPGNPWHPITVTLDDPLGDRQLLDGHTQPAVPVE